MCSEEAFINSLIPLFAKTFKLNVGKVRVHLKIMLDDLQVKNFARNKPRAKISSSAAPCDYPQKLTCDAADDDSFAQTGGLRRERIAAVAG